MIVLSRLAAQEGPTRGRERVWLEEAPTMETENSLNLLPKMPHVRAPVPTLSNKAGLAFLSREGTSAVPSGLVKRTLPREGSGTGVFSSPEERADEVMGFL